MSKAEEFIKKQSHIIENPTSVWISSYNARKAVEIAREEIYEWLANHYRDYMHNPTGKKLEAFFGGDMINDLKQVIKDKYDRKSS